MGQSPTAKVYLEKRAGKVVTVISGLHTYGADRMDAIAKELKSALGAGGTVKNGLIEIQGDKVVSVKAWFKDRISALPPEKAYEDVILTQRKVKRLRGLSIL